jgi:hypothetical protein
MNYAREEQLKNNFMSLVRSLEKHGSNLAKVSLGEELWSYANLNFYNTEFLNVYNKFNIPIVFGKDDGTTNYTMEFKVNSKASLVDYEPKIDSNPVGLSVVIIEEGHQKIKKDLRRYLGNTGTCILHLKNQGQYIVEFQDGNAIAFPTHNVKIVGNLELIVDASTVEVHSNGKVHSSLVKSHATGDEIENYLRSNVGKIDAVTITKRYFLAEI